MIGKSGSGKDTIYKEILKEADKHLVPLIPYTTRPRRADEIEGLNYHFVTEEQLYICILMIRNGYFVVFRGNPSSQVRIMQRCAGGFWQTSRIFRRRS